ncbi:hypothetical protein FOMPIDRAFT_1021015 [Fomitopsis schrenkii]|uniref:RING-type domain-containing protein n=1 Tax=Fomitopsis schrenkii TaxID=2126942 RepID=S8DMD4_FOMSC|nr:hypothetical protein FOMPIDRAFT_1021015 [Fomitopsis schrenkii]
MHPSCQLCAEDFTANANANATPVAIGCGHMMCRLCSPDPVKHDDVLPLTFTFEQPGNVATADELIERQKKALRKGQLECAKSCGEATVDIRTMERCILTQAERIDKHAQTLARKSTTLSLHRERVNELLQQCHFELNQIFALESQPIVSSNGSHAQLVQHRGRTDQNSGAGRTRKRALSLDSTILDGPGTDEPTKRRRV